MDGAARRKNAQLARGLQRIDPDRQVTCQGAGLELAKGFGVNAGMAHVQFQGKVRFKGVGALHHNIKGLDAVNGDVAFGEDVGLGVVEVQADKNAEFFGQGETPSLHGCDAATGAAATPRPVAALQQPYSG